MELHTGDRISISYKDKRKRITKEVTIVDAESNKNFIVVNNGIYNDTIDRFTLDQGKISIKPLPLKGGKKNGLNL